MLMGEFHLNWTACPNSTIPNSCHFVFITLQTQLCKNSNGLIAGNAKPFRMDDGASAVAVQEALSISVAVEISLKH